MKTLVLVILSFTATIASADPPGLTSPSSETTFVDSYRLETLTADGAALLGLVAVLEVRDQGLQHVIGGLAAGTYLLGAPVIHAVHHRPGRAVGSLAMRAAIPITVALLMIENPPASTCDPDSTRCDDFGYTGWIVIGTLGGAAAASILDTVFLAKGDPKPERTWSPTVTASHGGAMLGVGGKF